MTWGQGLYLPSWIERKPDVLKEYTKMDNDVLKKTIVDQLKHIFTQVGNVDL